jgi:hypothetical protein
VLLLEAERNLAPALTEAIRVAPEYIQNARD